MAFDMDAFDAERRDLYGEGDNKRAWSFILDDVPALVTHARSLTSRVAELEAQLQTARDDRMGHAVMLASLVKESEEELAAEREDTRELTKRVAELEAVLRGIKAEGEAAGWGHHSDSRGLVLIAVDAALERRGDND